MRKLFIIYFLASGLLLGGCDPDNTVQPTPRIYFTGITQTDANGFPISIDSSDWRTDDNWTSQESALFASSSALTCTPSSPLAIALFPNPSTGVFSLSLSQPTAARFSYRLVDEDFNVLMSADTLRQNISVNVSSFNIQDTIRLYYKFHEGNCEWRGHGDILIRQ